MVLALAAAALLAAGAARFWLGYPPVPSDANFVLYGGLADSRATWEALLDRGVLVRDVGIPHHLRVTAGTPDETSAFLRAMADLPDSHRQHAPDTHQQALEARA